MAFIAFEGLDGSGKSTLIEGLKAEFARQSLPFVVTREPGGTPLGEEIRKLLLRVDGEAPVPRAEALLYQASRAQHVEKVIRPAMKQGAWVLCDRFTASSIAFQGGGRDIENSEIDKLNRFATAGLEPDLNVLLDLSVEESLRRMSGRAQEADRFEREEKPFHQRVREAYLQLAKANPGNWLVLSSTDTSAVLLGKLLQEFRGRKWLA